MFFIKWILLLFWLAIVSGLCVVITIFAISIETGLRNGGQIKYNTGIIIMTITALLGIFAFFKGDIGVIHHFCDSIYTSSNHIPPVLWGEETAGNGNPSIFYHAYSVDISSDDTYGYNDVHSQKYYVDHVTKLSPKVTEIDLDNSDKIFLHSKDGKFAYSTVLTFDD